MVLQVGEGVAGATCRMGIVCTHGICLVLDAFKKLYGSIGDPLDEDTWLCWYGIFVSGWVDGRVTMIKEVKNADSEFVTAKIAGAAQKVKGVHRRGN
jgi:hypothetical protein